MFRAVFNRVCSRLLSSVAATDDDDVRVRDNNIMEFNPSGSFCNDLRILRL